MCNLYCTIINHLLHIIPGAAGTRYSLNLGSYGVEFALKNMEYMAMDDRYSKERLELSICALVHFLSAYVHI